MSRSAVLILAGQAPIKEYSGRIFLIYNDLDPLHRYWLREVKLPKYTQVTGPAETAIPRIFKDYNLETLYVYAPITKMANVIIRPCVSPIVGASFLNPKPLNIVQTPGWSRPIHRALDHCRRTSPSLPV